MVAVSVKRFHYSICKLSKDKLIYIYEPFIQDALYILSVNSQISYMESILLNNYFVVVAIAYKWEVHTFYIIADRLQSSKPFSLFF